MPNTKFFDELVAASGYMDKDSVKRVYYGLVKLLSRELRVNSHVKMPDWGIFSLVLQAQRKVMNIHTKQAHILDNKKLVKYEADYKLKDYFKNL